MGDDNEWLFDSISQFLRSPWWTCPIQTFIDENCVVFDAEEESSLQQTTIHQGFRELVDSVLGEHLASLGLTAEQFIAACVQGKNKELHALVSEYILALDDFVVFKKMMEKRNVELELEALKCLKLGIPLQFECIPPSEDTAGSAQKQIEEEERAMLEAAIAQSIQDVDVYKKELEMEEAQLEHALAISLALAEEERRKAEIEAEKLAEQDAKKAEEEKKRIDEEHEKNVEALRASYETEKAEIVHRKAASISSIAEASASALCTSAVPTPSPTPPTPAPAPDAPPPSAVPDVPPVPPAPSAPAPAVSPSDVVEAPAKSHAAPSTPSEMTPTLGNVKLGHLGHAVFGSHKAPLPAISSKTPASAPAPIPSSAPEPAPAAPAAPAPAAKAPDADEVAKRAEYLKQQRQRLLELKKQERSKELEDYEKTQTEKAAAVAIPAKPEIDEQQREMRIALARRFKEDLINETKQAALRGDS